MRTSHSLLSLLLITASLLSTGCSKSAEEKAATAAANSAAEERDAEAEAAPANETPTPKIDFWKPMASYIAGDYSSSCMNVGKDKEARPMTLKIGADGQYEGAGYSGNLAKGDMVIINRSYDKDGAVRFMFSAGVQNRMFSLMTNETSKGRAFSVTADETSMLSCQDASGIPMSEKPLHVVLGPLLTIAPMKVNCVGSGQLTPVAVEFSLKDGVLSFGDAKYPLSEMNESVIIKDGMSSLVYTATRTETESAAVGLDGAGKVTTVIHSVKDKGMTMCSTEA